MANIKKYQRGGMSRAYPKNFNPIDLLDIPQKELMNILFNERKRPSEIMSGDELGSQLMGKDNYGLLADLLLDPLNAVPLSLVKYSRGLKGTKKIPLSIAQKVGNTLWAGDKINDINAINQSEVVYPYLSSLLNNNNNMKKQFGGSTKPLHTLQFGGLSNIPMFDVFNNMNTQWNSFWRGNGDYFKNNYDPQKYQLGNPISIGPSVSNYQVSDRRFTQPDGNILSNFLYNYLPNNEFGTGFHYYTDLPKYDQFLHAVENIPGLLKKRKDQLNKLKKGYTSPEEKVIDDLYKEYVGKKSKLQDYSGALPESLKNEKVIKTLPKDLENVIYEDAMEAFSLMDKSTLKTKDGFYKVPVENVELGNFTTYINPKTKELRYYDKYDLDQIPLADKLGNPYTIYNRIKESEYTPTQKEEKYKNNIKKAKVNAPLTKKGNTIKMQDYKTNLQLADQFGIVPGKEQLLYWNEDDAKRNLVKNARENTNEYQNGGEIQKNFMKKTNKYQKGAYIPQKQFGGAFDSINNTMNTWKGFWNSPGLNYFDFFGNGIGGIQNIANNNNAIAQNYTNTQNSLNDFYKGSKLLTDKDKADYAMKTYGNNFDFVPGWENGPLGREMTQYGELTKSQNESKRMLGDAFTNTTAGIMTGMQYLGSYKPEEKINTQRGFQGVQYSQMGGPVNEDDAWIQQLMNFEAKQGLPDGGGHPTWGYNNWQKPGRTNAPQDINQAVDYFKEDYLPQVASYPLEVRKRLGDYKYNTGRSIEDLLLYASGKITLDDINSKKVFTKEWEKNKKEIEGNLNKPEFIQKLNSARDSVAKTTHMVNGQENPAYNNTWYDRVRMFDPVKISKETRGQLTNPALGDMTFKSPINARFKSEEDIKSIMDAAKEQGWMPGNQSVSPITNPAEMYPNAPMYGPQGRTIIPTGGPQYGQELPAYFNIPSSTDSTSSTGSNIFEELFSGQNTPYNVQPPYAPNEVQSDNKGLETPYKLVRGGTKAVAEYQQMLKNEGLYDGPIDGDWGKKTKAAYEKREIIERQKLLKDEGLYKGKIDGKWGPKSEAASKAFGNRTKNLQIKQMGGHTNLEGFTPDTPSYNNPYNKIPGDTVQTQQTPFNLLGIGSTGEIKIMQANNPDPYKFWGAKHVTEIPSFQYGGEVGNPNSVFSMPIIPSMMEDKLEYLQAEDGEVVFLPDGTIADVKATKKHKSMKKDDVTDILPSGYVFSNDPKMKFSRKSSILGTKFEDMNLGKTAFEYKENEITKGPEDIKLTDMFFGSSKKELSTAEIAKNIKKNLPLVDLKGDWFADTANEENKAQRVEYLTILKTFNEFKKPKKSKMQPPQQMQMQQQMGQAQYGMQTTAPKNYFNLGMDYMNKASDPFARMDNNMVTRFSANNQFNNLPTYQYGGGIRQAPLGMAIGAAVAPLLGNLVGHFTGRSARKKQERINREDLIRFSTLQDNLRAGINQGIGLDNLTNLSTYAAGLNVPLSRFDDMTSQRTMSEEAFRKQRLMLQSSKMTAGTYSGLGSSMARYMNPSNRGEYLASLDNHNKDITTRINEQLAQLEGQRANANINYQTQGTANRNNALNARDTQLYNVNVSGIGNIGNSLASGQKTRANMNYQLGMEKMTYEDMQRQKAQAAYDRMRNRTEGIFNNIGAGIGGIGDYMDIEGKTNSSSKTLQGMPTLPNSYKFVQNPNELHKLPSKTSPLVDFQINERRYPGPPSLYLQQWSPIEDRYPYDNAPQMPFGPLNMNGAPQFNFGYGPFGPR